MDLLQRRSSCADCARRVGRIGSPLRSQSWENWSGLLSCWTIFKTKRFVVASLLDSTKVRPYTRWRASSFLGNMENSGIVPLKTSICLLPQLCEPLDLPPQTSQAAHLVSLSVQFVFILINSIYHKSCDEPLFCLEALPYLLVRQIEGDHRCEDSQTQQKHEDDHRPLPGGGKIEGQKPDAGGTSRELDEKRHQSLWDQRK